LPPAWQIRWPKMSMLWPRRSSESAVMAARSTLHDRHPELFAREADRPDLMQLAGPLGSDRFSSGMRGRQHGAVHLIHQQLLERAYRARHEGHVGISLFLSRRRRPGRGDSHDLLRDRQRGPVPRRRDARGQRSCRRRDLDWRPQPVSFAKARLLSRNSQIAERAGSAPLVSRGRLRSMWRKTVRIHLSQASSLTGPPSREPSGGGGADSHWH
jgi:hypothetical protein